MTWKAKVIIAMTIQSVVVIGALAVLFQLLRSRFAAVIAGGLGKAGKEGGAVLPLGSGG